MIRKSLLIILCCLMCLYENTAAMAILSNPLDDPDMSKNVSELITSQGYPVEEHYVQTADGYVLSLQRIPRGRNSNMDTKKKDVVLFTHGILADSSMWVLNFPDQSLGFVLPDAGYDVWLLNNRGNTYSRKHVKYSTNQYQFWNFSFDQLAQYDVPDTIDYILKATGQKDLCIIGASQGTTQVFAMLSEMPDYNDKVKLFIAMAPVAWFGYTPSSARYLVPLAGELNTRFGFYLAHFPTSTSAKSLVHYAQEIKSFKFRKYDYGRSLNLEYYHQEEPPEYDVSRITTPVALFSSTNDFLGDATDVAILRRNLKSLVLDYSVPYPYNHLDFFVAMNAPQYINKPLLQLLSQY